MKRNGASATRWPSQGRFSLKPDLASISLFGSVVAFVVFASLAVVANRVRSAAEVERVRAALPEMEFLGAIPYDPAILDEIGSAMKGRGLGN